MSQVFADGFCAIAGLMRSLVVDLADDVRVSWMLESSWLAVALLCTLWLCVASAAMSVYMMDAGCGRWLMDGAWSVGDIVIPFVRVISAQPRRCERGRWVLCAQWCMLMNGSTAH